MIIVHSGTDEQTNQLEPTQPNRVFVTKPMIRDGVRIDYGEGDGQGEMETTFETKLHQLTAAVRKLAVVCNRPAPDVSHLRRDANDVPARIP